MCSVSSSDFETTVAGDIGGQVRAMCRADDRCRSFQRAQKQLKLEESPLV